MENGTDPPLRLLPVRTSPVSASRMYSLPLIKGTLHSRQSHPHRGRGSPRPHEAHALLTELFLSIMGGGDGSKQRLQLGYRSMSSSG